MVKNQITGKMFIKKRNINQVSVVTTNNILEKHQSDSNRNFNFNTIDGCNRARQHK